MPLAEADLRGIAEAIRGRVSIASARRWSGMLRTAILDLADSAERHPEADEAAALARNLHVRFAGKKPHIYRILYTYSPDEVMVHRVRHAAQDVVTEEDL
ncbi:MAG: hypothetical protein C0467_23010 [Planctomycetaceae bacterium]|nr:hypothetical protein [Planctomycetaceae bacterium]